MVTAGSARRLAIAADYEERVICAEEIGTRRGPVHAASILVWARVAELAGVPCIPATVIASIPDRVVQILMEGDAATLLDTDCLAIEAAGVYCRAGGYWRTELCAGDDVKYAMARQQDLPSMMPFSFDDMRIFEMHWGMPDIKVIGRPRMTPVRVNGYPVEFRVFHGGEATDGAVSWYYPQAGPFDITPELDAAMTQAVEYGARVHVKRAELGLVPWLPEVGPESEAIGSTIDFMLTVEEGLVMVDAGPGFGHNAHPCCFIDQPIVGRAWHLADGVALR